MAAGGPDYMLEFAHGYTYSAHPVACAAGIARWSCWSDEDAIGACASWRRASRPPCTA
jgi:beta-alanine--pyruvate transaminase